MKCLLVLALGFTYLIAERAIETNPNSACNPECGPNQKCYNSQCICDDDSDNFNCTKSTGNETVKCPTKCGLNAECVGGFCLCMIGYYEEFIDSADCIPSICPNGCGANDICFHSECISNEELDDYPNTTNNTTITIALHTKSTSTTESTIATNGTTTTNSTTATNSTTTTNGTSTTDGTITTTTPTPTLIPTAKPKRAGLPLWSLVAGFFLLGSFLIFGGFMLYINKYRGSYSPTPTQRV